MKTNVCCSFWAKKANKDGFLSWLPLKQHLKDAMDISGYLWEHWLSESQKQLIDNSFEKSVCGKNVAMFLAAVHDIGKATPAFQTKSSFKELDDVLLNKLELDGFKDISRLNLQSSNKTPHNRASHAILCEHNVCEDICAIVSSHHGLPLDFSLILKDEFNSYAANYFQEEDENNMTHIKWKKEQEKFLNWALEETGFKSVKDLPKKIKQSGQMMLSALLIMADWIASNENYFPLIELDQVADFNEKRSQEAFLKWKKTSLWQAEDIYDINFIFKETFGFDMNDIQFKVSKSIKESENPGLLILEAPMGIGKTETALFLSQILAYKKQKNGIYFGLPTQATSNGIFNRILLWVQKLDDKLSKELSDDKKSIRLCHGKACLNDDFRSLATNIHEEDNNKSILVNEWFSGKKSTSLDDFVVGTVDQFLMCALKQKHVVLKHLGFSKKVIIIDEVHAYDAYMNKYLQRAIMWMGYYDVPVILLSATLPNENRMKLIEAYLNGKGTKIKDDEKLEGIKNNSYPLLTYTDGTGIHQFDSFEKMKDKKIEIKRIENEDFIKVIEEEIKDGGVIGIVVNTVKKAQEIAKNLISKYDEEIVMLLHSGFIDTERVEKERELMNLIGRNSNRPYKKIIIGTQVIEQSLDIDFDVMISELAPIDLLIQRIGRLHRRNIKRNKKHESPKLYVLGALNGLEFDEGTEAVYDKYILYKTLDSLPNYIKIPSDISNLVNTVYSKEINPKYAELLEAFNQKQKQKQDKATAFMLGKPKGSKCNQSIIGLLENLNHYDSDESAIKNVRDIEETIEVIALKKKGEGYRIFSGEEDISNKINDKDIEKMIARNTVRLPRILSKNYNIDETIKILEQFRISKLNNWSNSTMLKGSLGIIFDENNEFYIKDIKLKYDKKYGITWERK